MTTYLSNVDIPHEYYDDPSTMMRVDTQLNRLDRAVQKCTSEHINGWSEEYSNKSEFDTILEMRQHFRDFKDHINDQECPSRSEQKVIVIINTLLDIMERENPGVNY